MATSFTSMKMGIFGILVVCLVACAAPDPYDVFKKKLDSSVGLQIGKLSSHHLGGDQRMIVDVIEVGDGKKEYRYKWIRSCRYVFEVNEGVGEILRWRLEGDLRDCYFNP